MSSPDIESDVPLNNGARVLLTTLEANDVDICFANPGTSEMHFVSALDQAERIRGVLGLFEGVVTGAADGYARMAGKPAATLLHLGPGLANGLSNLHNAIRARSPMINVIGDHATYHRHLDAPLTSDIEGAARPFSDWVRTVGSADTMAVDTAESIRVARDGHIASLILPSDTAWNTPDAAHIDPVLAGPASPEPAIEYEAVEAAAQALHQNGSRTALLLGPRAATEDSLASTAAIAERTGATVLLSTFIGRIPRGAGRHAVKRVPYPVPAAQEVLHQFDTIILVGAKPPVAFFAYPHLSSVLTKPGTSFIELTRGFSKAEEACAAVRSALGEPPIPTPVSLDRPELPSGAITPESLGAFLGHSLPEHAIVVDESVTTGRAFESSTHSAPTHDWLTGTGGSIGYGLAASTGAALACPDRPVITLEADGSGMYMPQALWTQAREQLNITTLIFSNRKYEILRQEMTNVGVPKFGAKAEELLNLDTPTIDWTKLGESMGVPSRGAETIEELHRAFDDAQRESGPHLIEVVL